MPAKADFLHIKQLKQLFQKKDEISLKDIYSFYKKTPKATVSWRIYKLLTMGVLERIGRGVYKLGAGTIYHPEIPKSVKQLYSRVSQNFPYANTCVWHTSSLNEFTVHQAGKHSILIEVEKDAAESVFNFLNEHHKEVFLSPSKEVYNRYIAGKKEGIIVLPLISEAPIQVVDGISTVTIEKILVDIFSDNVLFAPFQGNEMRNIFLAAMEKYTVNRSTLNRYAYRRGRKEELIEYISQLDFRQ